MKYFAFDLETTGINVLKEHPVQIGYAIVDTENLNNFDVKTSYVDTDKPISEEAFEVHKISREMTKGGLSLKDLGTLICEEIKRHEVKGIIGFNSISFDIPLVINSCKTVGLDLNFLKDMIYEDPSGFYLADFVFKTSRPVHREDYLRLKNRGTPRGMKYNQPFLCEKFGVVLTKAHDAGADIQATIELWKKLKFSTGNDLMIEKDIDERTSNQNRVSQRIEVRECDFTHESGMCYVVQYDEKIISTSLSQIIKLAEEFQKGPQKGKV